MEEEFKNQLNKLKCYITKLEEENNVLKHISQSDLEEIKRLKEECKQKDKKIKDFKFTIKTLAEDL